MVAVSRVLALLLIILAVVGSATARMCCPGKLAWGAAFFAILNLPLSAEGTIADR